MFIQSTKLSIRPTKLPIRPTKSAYPTYKKYPIRPTKKFTSDLQISVQPTVIKMYLYPTALYNMCV